MGRRLPDYDPEKDGDYQSSKRRIQCFKRIYQNYYHWQSLRETGQVGDVITVGGEDIYIGDLLVGQDTLPRQQRRAFDLICLQGYTESAATAIMLPDSKWSTPVQQYSDDGLKKMIAAYDAKQAGTWNPEDAVRKRRAPAKKKDSVVPVEQSSPEVPVQPVPASEPTGHPRWDFGNWSEDHTSLAAYINIVTGLGITPAQVKAVAFLRKEWSVSPEHQAELQRRQELREAERLKYASETPEQRKARHRAARRLKSAELAAAKLKRMQDEIRQLRIEAGLEPNTGDPVVRP